jgi:beta-glucanase (GH16 family)
MVTARVSGDGDGLQMSGGGVTTVGVEYGGHFEGEPTWPYQIEYDLVETNSERNGGYCNVHYGQTNTQTGPHNFYGDLRQWHTYACELNSEGVVFNLDGNVIKKLTGDHVRSKFPHRLGIQLDVSSDGRTGPDTDMLIDWVRVARFK